MRTCAAARRYLLAQLPLLGTGGAVVPAPRPIRGLYRSNACGDPAQARAAPVTRMPGAGRSDPLPAYRPTPLPPLSVRKTRTAAPGMALAAATGSAGLRRRPAESPRRPVPRGRPRRTPDGPSRRASRRRRPGRRLDAGSAPTGPQAGVAEEHLTARPVRRVPLADPLEPPSPPCSVRQQLRVQQPNQPHRPPTPSHSPTQLPREDTQKSRETWQPQPHGPSQ